MKNKPINNPYVEAGELLLTHIKLALTNTETGSVTHTDVSNELHLENGGPAASTFSNWVNGKTVCSEKYLEPIAELSADMAEDWAPHKFIHAYEYLVTYGKARKNGSLPLNLSPPELALRFLPAIDRDDIQIQDASGETHDSSSEPYPGSEAIPINQDIFTLDQGDQHRRGIMSFQYARRQDEFVARDQLVETIVDEFLDFEGASDNKSLFRWTLVHGDAGIGKSRFGLETLRCLYEKKAAKYPKRYWGFVKRDRRDASLSLSEEKINAWSIDGPAFLILDYAGTNRDLVEIIAALKSRALVLQQPIRLMLLERRSDSGRVGDLNRIDTEDSFLRDSCYQPKGYPAGGGIGIRLMPLDDSSTAMLMRKRIERERGYVGSNETDEYLCQRVDDICLGERRPLFAAMVASAIADENPDEAKIDSNLDRLVKRSETLHYLIRRERDKYWRDETNSTDLTPLGEHENLLALATFTRGLDFSIFDSVEAKQKVRLPVTDRFDQERYMRMATSSQRFDLFGLPLGFIEPDFIGEWFVLSRLSPQARLESNVPINRPDPREFIDLAWEHGEERAAQFVRQCHQNYPDEVSRLGYLLPQFGKHLEHVIPLLRDLMLDWRKEIAMLQADAQESEPQQEAILIAERATEVFKLLQNHVDKASHVEAHLRDFIAETLESYVYIQTYLISPSIRSAKDDRLITHSHESGRSRQKSLVESSLGIQEFLQQATLGDAVAMRIAEEESSNDHSPVSTLNNSALGLVEEYTKRSSNRSHLSQLPRGTKEEPLLYELAAKLLVQAAKFFRTLASQNEELAEQMNENSRVFVQLAELLDKDPIGQLQGSKHCELAGRLLKDAAKFFRTIATQNPGITDQMNENADVYETIGNMVTDEPFGILGEHKK